MAPKGRVVCAERNRHEDLVTDLGVGWRDSERRGRPEAEAGVVAGVAEDEHQLLATLVGAPKSFADERRADAATLAFGRDAHRAELEHAGLRAEPDVAQ